MTKQYSRDNSYTLGASPIEQDRLEIQSEIYGDKQYLKFADNNIVCEIGCGAGANLDLARQLTKGKYIGIDIQKEQIEAAKEKANREKIENVIFIESDARNILLEDDSVDAAFCRFVLIHQPIFPAEKMGCLALLKEMYRITKPEGRIIVIEPDVRVYDSSKPFLMKCFRARCEYSYHPKKGAINLHKLLPSIFESFGLGDVKPTKYNIDVSGKNQDKLRQFYLNWLRMMEPIKNELFSDGIITKEEHEQAKLECSNIEESDYIRQTIWIIEGKKEMPGNVSQGILDKLSSLIVEHYARFEEFDM